jgi:hypothetical protein
MPTNHLDDFKVLIIPTNDRDVYKKVLNMPTNDLDFFF